MFEREMVPYEVRQMRSKLDSVDQRAKAIVGSAAAIETAVSSIERRVDRYLSDISYGIEAGLGELASAFEWGMAEVVYHLELQREELKRIVKILEAPLETQARELRRRAEFAYRSGWFDEALADFLEAEKKNYADFTVHQNIGNLYLTKGDLTGAQKYYESAAKYARPHSRYYTAYALWHLGRVKHQQEQNDAAYEATKEAISLEPGLVQAVYDHARYCALLGREEEAIANLRKAIESDLDYSLKALADDCFAKMRGPLTALLGSLRDEIKQDIQEVLEDCRACLDLAAEIKFDWYPLTTPIEPKEQITSAEALVERNDIFGFADAYPLARNALDTLIGRTSTLLESRINTVTQEISAQGHEISKATERRDYVWGLGCLGTWLLGLAIIYVVIFVIGTFAMSLSKAVPLLQAAGIFAIPLILAILIESLIKHLRYDPIIREALREQQTLESELSTVNSLYDRLKTI